MPLRIVLAGVALGRASLHATGLQMPTLAEVKLGGSDLDETGADE